MKKTRCKCGCCFEDKDSYHRHYQVCDHMNWHLPPKGLIKLNTDGSCKRLKGDEGLSAGAGLIRDHEGVVLVSFGEPLGITNSMLAEMRAMKRGLEFVFLSTFNRVIVETDNGHLIGAIKGALEKKKDFCCYILNKEPGNKQVQVYWHILLRIRAILLDPKIHFTLSHIYNDANKAADTMANLGVKERAFRIWLPKKDEAEGEVVEEAEVVEVPKEDEVAMLVKKLLKQLHWDSSKKAT
ncbi:hypothetical protein CASFOL_008895 [Castilleja foliolosa]|uniref:RNase H type-1 domain-containing protein n=1 Tax=Castilleja foliolosa TaxID=1961234 RepID=A0ABD3E1Q8_9LAMI